ncbi:hypothetical protein GLE_3597 [Lysobacter enzymogenes]|uniref:Uncharacterized protein n=1 Tax=Lysobacter enzymogenes TaxID=69 RepID=A0A0S2DKP7_LYSEN|nr:hypothetical protein GLE_3597 [Lysobacter enzymogenes]
MSAGRAGVARGGDGLGAGRRGRRGRRRARPGAAAPRDADRTGPGGRAIAAPMRGEILCPGAPGVKLRA